VSEIDGELRPAYRTLDDPTRLLGVSLGGWAALLVAGAAGYAFLGLSPLPWRLNVSIAVIALGAPVLLLILREPGTIGPVRLLAAVVAWRARPARVVSCTSDWPVRRGALRLDRLAGGELPLAHSQRAEQVWDEPPTGAAR